MVLRGQEKREVQDVEEEEKLRKRQEEEDNEVIEWPSNERLEHFKRGGRD